MDFYDFEIKRTEFDIKELKEQGDYNRFMSLAIEIFKETIHFTTILGCTYGMNKDFTTRKWNRNEAILMGLMIRLSKLQIAFLDQICQKRMEIAFIVSRPMLETQTNLMYLIGNDENIFNEYMRFSLKPDRLLMIEIEKNIRERGKELPIERRMRKSILKTLEKSGFDKSDLELKQDTWGKGTFFDKAKKVGWDKIYDTAYRQASHAIHGNWQDLLNYHLDYSEDEFMPKTDWKLPQPQILTIASVLSVEVNIKYAEYWLPDCDEKNEIIKKNEDIRKRALILDEIHEEYLNK